MHCVSSWTRIIWKDPDPCNEMGKWPKGQQKKISNLVKLKYF